MVYIEIDPSQTLKNVYQPHDMIQSNNNFSNSRINNNLSTTNYLKLDILFMFARNMGHRAK